jgi:hypothetical protein
VDSFKACLEGLRIGIAFIEEQSPGTSGLTPAELKIQSHMAHHMLLFYKSAGERGIEH